MLWWKSQLGKYYLNHTSLSLIAQCRDTLLSQTTKRHTLRHPPPLTATSPPSQKPSPSASANTAGSKTILPFSSHAHPNPKPANATSILKKFHAFLMSVALAKVTTSIPSSSSLSLPAPAKVRNSGDFTGIWKRFLYCFSRFSRC